MRRPVILAVCIVLCLVFTLTGTISYLYDSDGKVNTMTLGQVQIEIDEFQRTADGNLTDFVDGQVIYPQVGETDHNGAFGLPSNPTFFDKIVRLSGNSRNADAYLRVWIGVPAAMLNVVDDQDAVHLVYGNGVRLGDESINCGSWIEGVYVDTKVDNIPYTMFCFNYSQLLAPGEITPPVLEGLYLDKQVDNSEEGYTFFHEGKEYPLDCDLSNGLQVLVLAQAVQADGFESAAQAFADAGMDDVDFDAVLNLEQNILQDIGDLIKRLQDAYAQGTNIAIDLKSNNVYDLASEQMREEINKLSSGDTFDVGLVVPKDQTVTLKLGLTSLPDNLGIEVQEGGVLELVGLE